MSLSMVAKALLRTLFMLAIMAALLFAFAGTMHWFGAYVFLTALGASGLLLMLWLGRSDQALFKERMEAARQEKPPFDRIVLPLLNIFLGVWIVAMAFDVRVHGAGQMPAWVSIVGGIAIAAGFLLVGRVMRENTFASSIVKLQAERGQRVIDTGPYAVVRHPMYAAASIGYAAIPFALGSTLGLLGAPIPVLILAVRILFEERFLIRELPGYADYTTKVRFRLIPFVW